MSTTTGKVWIVGAGPGAPDLLTLRAARTIEQAEVLIWTDSLVNPQLAAMAPQDCERIRTSTLTLEEVMLLMLDRVKQGKRVVRLHDGDTCLYSALNEQLCRLLDADVAVEVVPGLSAYQATAARLNSELTIPGLVQTIVLGRAGGEPACQRASPWSVWHRSRPPSACTSVLVTSRRCSVNCCCTIQRTPLWPLAIASAGPMSGSALSP